MLRGLWAFAVFVVLTGVLGVSAMLVSLVRRESDFTMQAGRLWSRAMLAATGARVDYSGLERMRRHLPCIYVSNHQSSVDIWALMRVLPLPTRLVAKQVLFRVPALGWAMAASGFIPIDRADRRRAIRSLERAGRRIRSGRPVLLFPEGTRSRDGRLQPFKKGAFHVALQARVPVVPVAVNGSWRVLRPGSLRVRPGRVTVSFLEPIDVTPYLPDRHDDLRLAVHSAIAGHLSATDTISLAPAADAAR